MRPETAIYFLINRLRACHLLHRLRSDEISPDEGGPLEIVRFVPGRRFDVARLGLDLDAGERPQIVIPAGTWFGTELARGSSHCLVGCTVAPGFDFADFELAEGPELAAAYPALGDRIARMSRRSDPTRTGERSP